jgi:hypothetical protein
VISAFAPPASFLDLPFISPTGAVFHDYEALLGSVTVSLYQWQKGDWQLMTTLESDEAGIEWGSPNPVTSMQLQNFSRTFGPAPLN